MPSLGLKQYDFPILIFWLLLWSPRYLIRLQGQDWLNTDPWFLTYSSVSFYPFIDSVTQLTAPGVKSFLFYNLLLFLLIKFFKPTGTAHNFFFFGRGGWFVNINYGAIFIFYLHSQFSASVAEYKAKKSFTNTRYPK